MKLMLSFFIFFFISCSTGFDIPTNIIKPSSMADILVDVSIAEGFSESFLYKDSLSKKDSVLKKEVSRVLQIHNISPNEFSKSYKFYSSRPIIFKMVMDSANARIIRGKDKEYTNDSLNAK